MNLGRERFEIRPEMRIAQLVIAPFARATLISVEELSITSRDTGSFGHSDS